MKTLEYSPPALPSLSPHAEGVSDIVEKARCGLVIPPDDPRALADAILLLTTHPEVRGEMGRLEGNWCWQATPGSTR